MRCDAARELLGVVEEASVQQRAELRSHLAGCADCAVAAAEETAFRTAMAARPILLVRPGARAAMMQVPPPGALRMVWRRRLTRGAPAATAAIAVMLGTWYLQNPLPWATEQDHDVGAVLISEGPSPRGDQDPIVAATPVSRVASVRPTLAGPPPAELIPTSAPVEAPAPAVVIIAPRPADPVVIAPSEPAATDPRQDSPGPPEDPGDIEDPGESEDPDDSTPEPNATPTGTAVTYTTITVQALTDLAGGATDCPGCDGITPLDVAAARLNPVGAVRVTLHALDAQGAITDLGPLTLAPTDAGTASAVASVPEAAAYAVAFVDAAAGFTLCGGAEARITLVPTEGGLFATFRLWRGCPAP